MPGTRFIALAACAVTLSGSALADSSTVTGATTATTPPVEKMICKTHIVTGSLVTRQRRCYTQSQWRYVNEQNEAYARKMMLDNIGKPPGN